MRTSWASRKGGPFFVRWPTSLRTVALGFFAATPAANSIKIGTLETELRQEIAQRADKAKTRSRKLFGYIGARQRSIYRQILYPSSAATSAT